ncbi:MAG: hypothetical protein AB7G39_03385 [Alphaproteobacteria bacterium]
MKRFTAPMRKISNAFRAMALEAGMPRMLESVGAVGRGIRNVAGEVLALGAKFAILSGAAAAGFYSLIQGAAGVGDELAKTARRVGLSTQSYAELEFAAKRAGISQTEYAVAMDQFNRRLGEMRAGKGELLSFLTKTNPKLLQQLKATKSTEEAFNLYMRAIDRLPDSQRQAVLAYNAFGRSGTKMTAMVSNGVGEVEELRAEFRRLAGDMTDFGERSEILSDAFDDMDTAVKGARFAILSEFMPAFTELAKGFTNWLAGNRGEVREWARGFAAELPGILRSLRDQFVGLRDALAPIFRAIWPLVERFGVLNTVAAGLGAVLSFKLISGFMSLIWAIRGLSLALLTTPVGWITAAILALGAAVAAIVIYWDDLTAAVRRFDASIPDWLRVLMTASPIGLAFTINRLFSDDGAPKLGPRGADRPESGAADLRPGVAAPNGLGVGPEVTVDFRNVPRGVEIRPGRNAGAGLDLSIGYSMGDALPGVP